MVNPSKNNRKLDPGVMLVWIKYQILTPYKCEIRLIYVK